MVRPSFYLTANTSTAVGLATTSAVLQGVLRKALESGLIDDPDRELVSFRIIQFTT